MAVESRAVEIRWYAPSMTVLRLRTWLPQIAVLKELDGKGPFCSLVMAVVVVKDVVVIIAYAINVELIRVVRRQLPHLTSRYSAHACSRRHTSTRAHVAGMHAFLMAWL